MHSFLSDHRGNKSSTRLVMAVWSFAILAVWVGVCAYKGEMIDIPAGVNGVLGIVLGGKVLQAFAEKESSPAKEVKDA